MLIVGNRVICLFLRFRRLLEERNLFLFFLVIELFSGCFIIIVCFILINVRRLWDFGNNNKEKNG